VNMAICWTAVIAFQNAPNDKCEPFPSKDPCKIQDLYTLNFQSFRVEFIGKFLVLFPAFTITTNYPLIAITFRNNVITLFKRAEEAYKSKAIETPYFIRLFTKSIFISALASIPPLIIGFFTDSLGVIVGLTGSIAGLVIQYVLPTVLVIASRMQWNLIKKIQNEGSVQEVDGDEKTNTWIRKPKIAMDVVDFQLDKAKNEHKSPFQNKYWWYAILAWSCISLVTSLVFQIKKFAS
jgi:hypothetical protein